MQILICDILVDCVTNIYCVNIMFCNGCHDMRYVSTISLIKNLKQLVFFKQMHWPFHYYDIHFLFYYFMVGILKPSLFCLTFLHLLFLCHALRFCKLCAYMVRLWMFYWFAVYCPGSIFVFPECLHYMLLNCKY